MAAEPLTFRVEGADGDRISILSVSHMPMLLERRSRQNPSYPFASIANRERCRVYFTCSNLLTRAVTTQLIVFLRLQPAS